MNKKLMELKSLISKRRGLMVNEVSPVEIPVIPSVSQEKETPIESISKENAQTADDIPPKESVDALNKPKTRHTRKKLETSNEQQA